MYASSPLVENLNSSHQANGNKKLIYSMKIAL